jgi:acetoacetyl-CoA synthetase
VPSQAAFNLIEVLTPIWRRVLQQSSINTTQNFFDLGGDPWMAIELFQEIAMATKRNVAPLLIYTAPTLGELSAVLESSAPPQFPRLVLLKDGVAAMPVFFIHGLGGNIMEFFQLLKYLQTPSPVYGLQARGSDGLEEPCSSIEEMAEFHVDAIKVVQPHGPYALIGYSLGGLVALEMARQLAESDESVALLVMIDSYLPLRYAPFAQRLGVYARRVRFGASRLLRSRGHNVSPHAAHALDQTADTIRGLARHGKVRNSLGIAFTPAMRRVQECATKALQDYRPRHYQGRIRFVRAGTPLDFPDDPTKVFAKFTDQLEVETVPGDHHELLTTQYESLAVVISRYLYELSVQRSTGSSQ